MSLVDFLCFYFFLSIIYKMKMAKKGFKFSKDLLFLMVGLMIVLGILFYVTGLREGFYQKSDTNPGGKLPPKEAKTTNVIKNQKR